MKENEVKLTNYQLCSLTTEHDVTFHNFEANFSLETSK